MKNKLRAFITNTLGYWFYKTKHLPIGTDIFIDLKNKVTIPLHTLFDVGANMGQTSLDYATHFPNSTIYAFEPIASTYKKLCENVKHLPQVKPIQIAIGNTQESIEINLLPESNAQQNSLNNKSQDNGPKEIVQVNTIDNLMSELNVSEIDLLKIDTEGFEMNVLNGAQSAFQNNKIKMIYIEVGFAKANTHNTNFLAIYSKMEELGFIFYGIYEISQIGIKTEYHYGNALFINKNEIHSCFDWQLN